MPADDHPMLDGLDEDQREAVTADDLPLGIIAGPGSGKTRVLTRRILYRIETDRMSAAHTLALTFTRKAASELRSRLRSLGLREAVAAGTFHAVAFAQLRDRYAETGRPPPQLLGSRVRFVARVLPDDDRDLAIDHATEIEWAKARVVGPDRYEAEVARVGRTPPVPGRTVADTYARYEDEKRRRGVVDFDDLLWLCAHAVETDDEFRRSQRWRHRHLFVDEFQDVNPLQFLLLRSWLGDSDDLCVVGDPNQAIYAWNGADTGYLVDFEEHFTGARIVTLRHTYRSSPQVLACAAAALSTAATPGPRLLAHRPDGPVPTITSHPTDADEAAAVARAARSAREPGRPWGAQAVLVRTNAQIPRLERAMRDVGVPARVRGTKPFAETPDVREALNALVESATPLATALDDLAGEDRSAGEGPDPERTAVLGSLFGLGRDFLAIHPRGDAAAFKAWLGASARSEGFDDGQDAVDLLTFHAAKGLEWDVVHIAGVEDGFVPISHAVAEAALDEERRLLYVALTRAARTAHLTWAEVRTFGTTDVRRSPSPFLAPLEVVRSVADPGPARTWRDGLADVRRSFESGP